MMKARDAEKLLIQEFGRMAAAYNRFSVTSSQEVWDVLRPLLPRLLGLRVLDLGCGPGRHALRLARAVGPSGSVVGVDAAKGMVEFARHRRGAIARKNLRFEQMDNRDLRFLDRSFDLVLSTFGLAIDKQEQAVREAFRVLGRGGQFMCVGWGKANRENQAFDAAVNELHRRSPPPPIVRNLFCARQVIASIPEKRRGKDSHSLISQLHRAGFRHVRRRAKGITMQFPSVTAYLRYRTAWGVYHRDLARLTPAEKRNFVRDVTSRLGWRSDNAGHPVTWELSFIDALRS